MPDPTPAATTTTDASPSSVTTTTDVKPGTRTTEFYVSVFVAFLGAFMSSGLVADGSTTMRLAGMIMTALSALGYVGARALVKSAAHKASASMLTEARVSTMIAAHHAAVMQQAMASTRASATS